MTNEYVYAGFWIRAAALLVDSFILNIAFYLLPVLLASIHPIVDLSSPTAGVIALIFLVLIGFSYYAFFLSSSWQATPGKKIVGIKVINTDGSRLSFLKALGRSTIGYLLSNCTFGIGYLMVGFTDKKTALHDKVFKTYVVYKE